MRTFCVFLFFVLWGLTVSFNAPDGKTNIENILSEIQSYQHKPVKYQHARHDGLTHLYFEGKSIKAPSMPDTNEVQSNILPALRNYVPKITPPLEHPRLWVTRAFLPELRRRILMKENAVAWEQVRDMALDVFEFDPDTTRSNYYSGSIDESGLVEKTIQAKAFYYLVTQDEKLGKEAISLLYKYYKVLNFGDLEYGDISRPIGRAIYIGSLVYDWCYYLIDENTKKYLRQKMLKIAHGMEISWPPIQESIVNGHGNEAQVNRDLLSMSIAVYNEDPIPYQYTSYLILEQLVPMRKFEYQSPRHNQGVDYGAYRFGWEMHAVWLFYRMSGEHIFDANIRNMPLYWQYMRLPGGQMLRDGDRFNINDADSTYYWKQPFTALLTYAYNKDPHLKAEFEEQGGLPDNPVLFLLINNPYIETERKYDNLPLTRDFGPILGSMIARTGWDLTYHSNDVIAEIKGGGYHFGNHQHSDAGSMQVFYKGFQVADLGLYLSYGTVYDFNFNKRSISHSMMLAVDPDEHIEGARHIKRKELIDGGTRFNQQFPKNPEETRTDPWFDNGTVLSTDFGPSNNHPEYSYFKADLTGAYSSKMSNYSREFCFLNFKNDSIPAAVILFDDMTTSKPEFQKYWQVNTLNAPLLDNDKLIFHNSRGNDTGKTHIKMLIPKVQDRNTKILSGAKANSNFDVQFDLSSNQPEAHGHRILVTPKNNNHRNQFLTVFQMTDGNTEPYLLKYFETSESHITILKDYAVSMSSSGHLINREFNFKLPKQKSYKVLLTGIKSGFWSIRNKDTQSIRTFNVLPKENTIYFRSQGTNYTVTPGRTYESNSNGHE